MRCAARRMQTANVAPNLVSPPAWIERLNIVPSPYAIWFESTRDVAQGEELLYDYEVRPCRAALPVLSCMRDHR